MGLCELENTQKCKRRPKTFVHDCSVILEGECFAGGKKLSNLRSFIVLPPRRASPLLINITELSFLVNQKYNEAFQGDCLSLRIHQKTFSQISYS